MRLRLAIIFAAAVVVVGMTAINGTWLNVVAAYANALLWKAGPI